MQKIFTRSATAACLILICPILGAQQSPPIRLITGISLGYSDFRFPEKLDHKVAFSSASIPIAITSGSWQLSLNLSNSLTKADIAEEEELGKASRSDVDFTLGYRLTNNWSLFAGYKYGKTSMHFEPRDFDEEDELDESDSEDDPLESDDMLQPFDESYKQQGPFVGISYSWQFEKAGNLNLSVGYAHLSATNQFAANLDEPEEDEELEFDDLTATVKGDTKGFSYGLAWTMPLSTRLLFQSRFKINSYHQDILVDDQRFNNIDETFTSLHVGLAYVF